MFKQRLTNSYFIY